MNDNLQNHLKYVPGEGEKAHALAIKKHTEYNPNNNWYVLRITRFSVNRHAFLPKKYIEILQYKDYEKFLNTTEQLKYYIPFISKQNAINCMNYLHSYFSRICLYLIASNNELCRGELKYIPWFDFSDPIFSKSPSEIDDYLFRKYNISNKIRKHIEEILPDYYGIRKGRD